MSTETGSQHRRREKAPLGLQPGEAIDATSSSKELTMTAYTGKPSPSQARLTPNLPALREALLDRAGLGAALRYEFDNDGCCDVLTVAYESAPSHVVFDDDEAQLCCRLEELGFSRVSNNRLRQAFHLLPHTEEHKASRQSWTR